MDVEQNEEEPVPIILTNVYGDVCFRKARRKRQKMLVQEMFYDYANNTTLHGLSYTTKKGLTLTEKIFWLITFVASCCLCIYLIRNVWIKWQTSPVIVTVSEQLVSVGKVPFPSVTICPQSKSKLSVYNYTAQKIQFLELTNINHSLSGYEEEFAKFDDITNVCTYASDLFPESYESVINRTVSNADVAKHIMEVAPRKGDLFGWCERNREYDMQCSDTVSEILTSEGLCYNFNSLAAEEILRLENIHRDYPYLTASKPARNWSIEHGYTNFGDDVYPVAGAENGPRPDLQIVLKDILTDRDEFCNGLNSGFKVYIQQPTDLPQSSLYYYAILNTQVSSMALSFSILNTSETLRKYSPQMRQCYFPDERYLKYFKIYTASNCRMECLSNFTFNHCQCVGFYMPRESSNKICTLQQKDCMDEARAEIQDMISNKNDTECQCLPSCNSIDYTAEILKTDFHLKKVVKKLYQIHNLSINLNGTKFSKLEMYYKQPRYLSMRRSELFGLTDFLANIGGLLGLFVGFSFLSLVELFYFLTLRLCCTLKKDLKEEKKREKNHIY